MKQLATDFVVVGSGLAGLQTAWQLAQYGEVLLFTGAEEEAGNSFRAQGGIAAAVGKEDSPDLHREDTLRTGAGMCNEHAVDVLVKEGPHVVEGLYKLGIPFDRTETGWALGREGSHSVSRILHASGDATGAVMVQTLLEHIRKHSRIQILAHTRVTDLVAEEGECYGVLATNGQEDMVCSARAVVLATGGCGQVFRYTTNDPMITGDGLAMAYRAGAVLRDMEFIQFHPTALAVEQNPMFLISEAVRGEGGILINDDGEAFMERYHDWKDLAPRDVVARAIYQEMQEGRKVFLDGRRLQCTFSERFPTIYAHCLANGIDPERDPIPVTPVAHFLMGGIQTDTFGRSTVHRLFAVGEVACTGVHGANRLASNSLLEGVVFARRVAEAAQSLSPQKHSSLPTVDLNRCKREQNQSLEVCTIRQLMWEYAGIIRDRDGLMYALDALKAIGKDLSKRDCIGQNMITVSQIILESALYRRESRGGHYRRDYPIERKIWGNRRTWVRRGEPVESVAFEKISM